MTITLPRTATPRLVIPFQSVPADAVAAARDRFGDALPHDPGGDAVVALLANGADRNALGAALDGNFSHIVELTDDGDSGGLWLGAPSLESAFFLSLTTPTAFSAQPALLICDTLLDRGALTAERRSPVELCLHEAVANGVVHGNLGISSTAKDQPEGYRLFSQLVNEQLRDPACRHRRLEIFVRWNRDELTMSISDEGPGFDVERLRLEPDGSARSGRGFMFMRALSDGLTIGAGGRCTTLRFEA